MGTSLLPQGLEQPCGWGMGSGGVVLPPSGRGWPVGLSGVEGRTDPEAKRRVLLQPG